MNQISNNEPRVNTLNDVNVQSIELCGKILLPIIHQQSMYCTNWLISKQNLPITIIGRPGMSQLLGHWRSRIVSGYQRYNFRRYKSY